METSKLSHLRNEPQTKVVIFDLLIDNNISYGKDHKNKPRQKRSAGV